MPTHQYQLTDAAFAVRDCGDASSLSLPQVASGHTQGTDCSTHATFVINELVIYYIDTSADFTLTITGGDASIEEDDLTVISGTSPSYSSTIDASGNLILTVTGPSTNDSEAIWQFDAVAPPLILKVRTKRQTDTISCDC